MQREQLLYYTVMHKGEWMKISKAVEELEEWKPLAYDGDYVTILDEEYPHALRSLQYAPWVIFYKGDLSIVNQAYKIGVVGSQKFDSLGANYVKDMIQAADQSIFVADTSKPIDYLVHSQAHRSVGVIGTGLDVFYPKNHAILQQDLCLAISEYPAGVLPLAHHYPWLSRIVSALSDTVIAIEIKKESLINIYDAFELNKLIYYYPCNYCSEFAAGCIELDKMGAIPLYDVENILIDKDNSLLQVM